MSAWCAQIVSKCCDLFESTDTNDLPLSSVMQVMVPWKWVVNAQVEVERRMSDGFSNGAAQSALYI